MGEKVIGEVISVKRLTSSVNGNPSWSLLVCPPESTNGFPAQRLRTKTDAICAYAIGDFMVGKVYEFMLNRGGRIYGIKSIQTNMEV